MKTRGNPRGW